MTSQQRHTVNTSFDAIPVTYPVGIFDSGVGGLTVAAAIRRAMPDERLLYLGDVARQPYGTKSPRTVTRYAVQAAEFLVEKGIKALVVACNTASAVALEAIAERFPGLPVLGVVEAGADGAARASARGRIVVAATEGTCRSEAYERAIARRRDGALVRCVPCPLFVALAEEGLTDGPIVDSVARHYLGSLFDGTEPGDCLVLGCTHFPLLAPALSRLAGPEVTLVDCAEATSSMLVRLLEGREAPKGSGGGLHLISTDAPERFARMAGKLFPALGAVPAVELADL
ncbi:Glutamate racemase [Paramagnetospirillum magneticum AMB-1]|uniref:Glutamate racemase n=1 Tax=Paramagnetospirillum magneticum (strain ATCC 700264 / AMB-1) TaxID=342108 RepID=Q2W1E5_PARM1|nr:glutamate racemase [Paramagnetospirillum magneticum]BAE52330.1 Glutamate racemase [Paramagnetospirillum magneticum AMB-1]